MNEKNTLVLAFAAAAVVIAVIFGVATGWLLPALIIGAVLIGAAIAIPRLLEAVRSNPVSAPEAPAPIARPASPPARITVGPVSLDTATTEFRLAFSATILWRYSSNPERRAGPHEPAAARLRSDRFSMSPSVETGPREHANPEALATAAALSRAAEIVGTSSPADATRTRTRLLEDLGWLRPDSTGSIQWWAEDVGLELSESDAERLQELSELRKKVLLWEHERDHEKSVRNYLGGDALRTTGSTVV